MVNNKIKIRVQVPHNYWKMQEKYASPGTAVEIKLQRRFKVLAFNNKWEAPWKKQKGVRETKYPTNIHFNHTYFENKPWMCEDSSHWWKLAVKWIQIGTQKENKRLWHVEGF